MLNEYLDAYCRLKIDVWFDYLKTNVEIDGSDSVSELFFVLKKAYGAQKEGGDNVLLVDGKATEDIYGRKKVIKEILEFLTNYKDVKITYFVDYHDLDDVDTFAKAVIEADEIYHKTLSDIYFDDYVVLISDTYDEDFLKYIKVYPNGKCKEIIYDRYNEPYRKENEIVLDKELFKSIFAHGKKMARKRKNIRWSGLMGDYDTDDCRAYFKYGYKAFGQKTENYESEEDEHHFTYETGVEVLDELIMQVSPHIGMPALLGVPELKRGPISYFDGDDDDETLDFLFTKRPTPDGKEKCEKLREIRKKFAEDNHIDYEFKECTHEGPCAGTCPLCDKEAKDLARIAKERGIKFGEED